MHEPTLPYRYVPPQLVKLGGCNYRFRTDPHGRIFLGDSELSAFREKARLQGRVDVLADLDRLGLVYHTLQSQIDPTDPNVTAWQLHRERRLNTQSRRSRTHRWL